MNQEFSLKCKKTLLSQICFDIDNTPQPHSRAYPSSKYIRRQKNLFYELQAVQFGRRVSAAVEYWPEQMK